MCATSLPGSESLNIEQCLATLDRWTDGIQRYSQYAIREFETNPEVYHHQLGFAYFAAMVTFLRHPRGLGISYQPTAIGNNHFWDSRDDFIHGMLTRGLGTCASMPVLYVAVGRRLGYPLHLAISNGHFFCQWVNDDGSRINLEGSGASGSEMLPDTHFYYWPTSLDARQLALNRYLRPLTREEELAAFLQTRANCFASVGRFAEAAEAILQAHQVAPKWALHEESLWALNLKRLESENRPCLYHYHDAGHSRFKNLFPIIQSIPGYNA